MQAATCHRINIDLTLTLLALLLDHKHELQHLHNSGSLHACHWKFQVSSEDTPKVFKPMQHKLGAHGEIMACAASDPGRLASASQSLSLAASRSPAYRAIILGPTFDSKTKTKTRLYREAYLRHHTKTRRGVVAWWVLASAAERYPTGKAILELLCPLQRNARNTSTASAPAQPKMGVQIGLDHRGQNNNIPQTQTLAVCKQQRQAASRLED